MSSIITVDHKEIKRWAQTHGAVPAQCLPPHHDGEPPPLEFVFPRVRRLESGLRAISWEDFFASFDVLGLALRYELQDDSTRSTRENELVRRGPWLTRPPTEEPHDA